MIYWFTGQPGHGKTLHAIDLAMQFKDKGREVYVCNVRDFDYAKTGMHEMTPEQFRDWPNFLPDGAVALVDECYEKDMLPKRAPGARVPVHVERLATHRHRGIDFIFVCQSPDKQVDSFVHDLTDRLIHVRRRFGTKFVHLREFDKYERNPEKANPLILRRVTLPKRPMGSYKSTELDTTEKKIPWYYFAFGLGVPLALFLMYYTFGNMGERLGGTAAQTPATGLQAKAATTEPQGEGGARRATLTPEEFVSQFMPRVPGQPWTAPVYDGKLQVSAEPPRVFCMSSGHGSTVESCTCLTEQGTRYTMDMFQCADVARHGQYEPFLDERGSRLTSGESQQREYSERLARLDASGAGQGPAAMAANAAASSTGGSGQSFGSHSTYGDIAVP